MKIGVVEMTGFLGVAFPNRSAVKKENETVVPAATNRIVYPPELFKAALEENLKPGLM